MNMYTLLYLKWIINKALLYSTGNSAQCYEAAWKTVGFGGELIHVYVCASPLAVPLKLSWCCQLARLQYKIKRLKKIKNKIFIHLSVVKLHHLKCP